jgi:hypothetical protein
MAQSHVIDQDTNVQCINQLREQCKVCLLVLGKVHGESGYFHFAIVGIFYVGGEG